VIACSARRALADVTFLVNQIRGRDARRGNEYEEAIRQAAGALETGEHLGVPHLPRCLPGFQSDPFFSVRIGQSGWGPM